MLILFNLSAAEWSFSESWIGGSFIIPAWIRLAVGVPLWLAGDLLALWAIWALGAAPTYGGEGALVCRGRTAFPGTRSTWDSSSG